MLIIVTITIIVIIDIKVNKIHYFNTKELASTTVITAM